MTKRCVTANSLFNELKNINWNGNKGSIFFSIINTTVKITHTDIIGNVLQDWMKNYFITNNIHYREPSNSQEFPDFFLSDSDYENLLEIKAFNYNRNPAFDIANFSSYCEIIASEPYKLFADYLIFGYHFDNNFDIEIKDIWLKKIWEIAGITTRGPYPPLKTQVKREMIYNIRPNSAFPKYAPVPFNTPNEFLCAIHATLIRYKGQSEADIWINKLQNSLIKFMITI